MKIIKVSDHSISDTDTLIFLYHWDTGSNGCRKSVFFAYPCSI